MTVSATYTVSSRWDFEELEIDPATVVDYYVKWDTLYVTFVDADGNQYEQEFEPTYSASDSDFKRPDDIDAEFEVSDQPQARAQEEAAE